MPLYRISETEFRDQVFGDDRITGYSAYIQEHQKIGTVKDILVDEEGHFRYLIIETGFWIFGKQILLPIGLFRSAPQQQRIYVNLTQQQVEALPTFDENATIDFGYEEQIRQIYRMAPLETSASLEAGAAMPEVPLGDRRQVVAAPIETTAPLEVAVKPVAAVPVAPAPVSEVPIETVEPAIEPPAYSYEQEPALYAMNDQDHQTFKLYEERLIAHKKRVKTGEVVIGKHTETRQARVLIPLERERVVFYRGQTHGQSITPDRDAFQSGEVLRFELYEETADLLKQPVVREEIKIRKETQQEIFQADAEIRREQLDVKAKGSPTISTPTDSIAQS